MSFENTQTCITPLQEWYSQNCQVLIIGQQAIRDDNICLKKGSLRVRVFYGIIQKKININQNYQKSEPKKKMCDPEFDRN